MLPRVYEDIVRVIDQHREHGDLTFLVTAAPIELADVIAEALGMDGAIATHSEVDADGFYTGRLVDGVMHGPAKAKAIAEVAAERGTRPGRLPRVLGFGQRPSSSRIGRSPARGQPRVRTVAHRSDARMADPRACAPDDALLLDRDPGRARRRDAVRVRRRDRHDARTQTTREPAIHRRGQPKGEGDHRPDTALASGTFRSVAGTRHLLARETGRPY